jgi:hypothetical protein
MFLTAEGGCASATRNIPKHSPSAIRNMLTSIAAAIMRCEGSATGASQEMTASTCVWSGDATSKSRRCCESR